MSCQLTVMWPVVSVIGAELGSGVGCPLAGVYAIETPSVPGEVFVVAA
jgi:hypothetical protein